MVGREEEVTAGSLEAILWELRHGDLLTVIDEVWHALDWLLPGPHFRFCRWAHGRCPACPPGEGEV
jgi:hypothetical protein